MFAIVGDDEFWRSVFEHPVFDEGHRYGLRADVMQRYHFGELAEAVCDYEHKLGVVIGLGQWPKYMDADILQWVHFGEQLQRLCAFS